MQVGRNAVMLVVVLGGLFLALVPQRRRRAAAAKLAESRRLVFRRIIDREACASRSDSERWDGEGGAIPAVEA
jgi:uncharacterized protein YjeT (DUF2065 family)